MLNGLVPIIYRYNLRRLASPKEQIGKSHLERHAALKECLCEPRSLGPRIGSQLFLVRTIRKIAGNIGFSFAVSGEGKPLLVLPETASVSSGGGVF